MRELPSLHPGRRDARDRVELHLPARAGGQADELVGSFGELADGVQGARDAAAELYFAATIMFLTRARRRVERAASRGSSACARPRCAARSSSSSRSCG